MHIEIRIRFKTGTFIDKDGKKVGYDPSLGGFNQWVDVTRNFTRGGRVSRYSKKGQDTYSRTDDLDRRPITSEYFHTNDYPGFDPQGGFLKGDVIDWSFSCSQFVYDTLNKDMIAKRGPHIITVKGTWPDLTITGIPYADGFPIIVP